MLARCPQCSFEAQVADAMVGRKAACPRCRNRFVLEAPEGQVKVEPPKRCPRCTEVELRERSAGEGLDCKECGGIYLSSQELANLLESLGIPVSVLPDLLTDGRSSALACPGCTGAPVEVSLRGQRIDLCPACGGAFFERRELAALRGPSGPPECCLRHPEVEGTHRCLECGELLCGACVQEGFEVFFCQLCGGTAEALDGAAPPGVTSTPEERYGFGKRSSGPVTPASVLLYPFRGLGIYLFVGYMVAMAIGAVLGPIRWLVALLMPAFLFEVARSTVAHRDELPDWPDFDIGRLLRDTLAFWVVTLLAMVPSLVVLWFAVPAVPGEPFSPWTLLLLVPTVAIGLLFWIPAFGSVAVYENGWLAPRIDRHLLAFLAGGRDSWIFAGLLVALFVVRTVLGWIFGTLPILGWFLAKPLELYGSVLGAHLVGLLFRRHVEAMDELYLR